VNVPLYLVAHARSGDKGDASNVGLIANSPELYEVVRREVTAERVAEHFREVCRGEVERFEVPNLLALNFLLHDSLGGGGTLSLKTDAQGKTHGQGLLAMRIEVPDELVPAGGDERLRAALERHAGAPAEAHDAGARGPRGSGGASNDARSLGAGSQSTEAAAAAAPAAGSAEALKGV
jgi:hypothetical protein